MPNLSPFRFSSVVIFLIQDIFVIFSQSFYVITQVLLNELLREAFKFYFKKSNILTLGEGILNK